MLKGQIVIIQEAYIFELGNNLDPTSNCYDAAKRPFGLVGNGDLQCWLAKDADSKLKGLIWVRIIQQ